MARLRAVSAGDGLADEVTATIEALQAENETLRADLEEANATILNLHAECGMLEAKVDELAVTYTRTCAHFSEMVADGYRTHFALQERLESQRQRRRTYRAFTFQALQQEEADDDRDG